MLQEKYEEWLSNQPDCEDRSPMSCHVWGFFEDVFGEEMNVVLSCGNHSHGTPSITGNMFGRHPCLIVMSRENFRYIGDNISGSILFVKDKHMGQVGIIENEYTSVENSYYVDIVELIPCNPITDDPDRLFADLHGSGIVLEKNGTRIGLYRGDRSIPRYIQASDLGLGSLITSFEVNHPIHCYRLMK